MFISPILIFDCLCFNLNHWYIHKQTNIYYIFVQINIIIIGINWKCLNGRV